jgi:cellulose synthase/poly-beta-1,6-N-acetylglucosamine synthase-like glycosyltransferase
MLITVILFWTALIILFFCYIGYGLVLYLFNAITPKAPKPAPAATHSPTCPVTIIIPAFNESLVLRQKIENTLALDYPSEKLPIIIVTDGSTDGSENIVKEFPQITLLHSPQRMGKTAAIKRAIKQVQSPVVVFSDANAMLNKGCIQNLVHHYIDPAVGGVAGEKRIADPRHATAIGNAEGLYWTYESFMKKQDSKFNTVVGAAGELYSIRTALFPAIDDKVILDDFVISMKVCLQGYRIAYEPGAYATELPSASLLEEMKRKVRISAGAYQSIGYLEGALNAFKRPAMCFQYLSRRLLRWTLCPFMLIVLLLTNILISSNSDPIFYKIFLASQIVFYSLALLGWPFIQSEKRMAIVAVPFYFVFMNYCLVRGFIKFLRGSQTVLWEKSRRQAGE